MTVSELIYLLSQQDPNAEVLVNLFDAPVVGGVYAEVLVHLFDAPVVGEVYGAYIERVEPEDGNVILEASTP